MSQLQHLSYIFNHVFLPPQLPKGDDGSYANDAELVAVCVGAWSSFQPYLSAFESSRWSACAKMLKNMLQMRDTFGCLVPAILEKALVSMQTQDVLAIHIRGQNAAIVIRCLQTQISVESFELSPTNNAVVSTKGRLRRCFPGPAIALSLERIFDPSFRSALVHTICTLDVETPQEVLPITSKAGNKLPEDRDTIHPKFVTEMLAGVLRGIGQPGDVIRIFKRTREEVMWNDVRTPWRRSPLWLLLRVALQTSLVQVNDDSHIIYKSFMVFFMAHILRLSLTSRVRSEQLKIMSAKISRRMLKLKLEIPQSWTHHVEDAIMSTRKELKKRWALLESHVDPFGTQKGWHPLTLDFASDTILSLEKLQPYIDLVSTRITTTKNFTEFKPGCRRRIEQSSSVFPSLSLVADESEQRLYLADIELWIENQLSPWLETNKQSQSSCKYLAGLIKLYGTYAISIYSNDPESLSLMILNLMDLWVALDKCAILQYSLLSHYSPEFPMALFESLLLPRMSQLQRLEKIEEYVYERTRSTRPSMFKGIAIQDSFAVQFYDQSSHHQALRVKIEAAARNARESKKSELAQLRQQRLDLMRVANSKACEYWTGWRRGRQITSHSYSCEKCRLAAQARELRIDVHEWPLPNGELAVKSAVFELDVPKDIVFWRDATYHLLVDFLAPKQQGSQQSGKNKIYTMKTFNGLAKYFSSESARLELASISKSFLVAHYRNMLVSEATEANVCVNNGLSYTMYDSKSLRWSKELLDRCDIRRLCTLQLSAESYKHLQFAVNETTHTSNEILALQSECPKSLNLHEFYAFASLRSGCRLQWRNIARELIPCVLNFNLEETHTLLLQTAWQTGKADRDVSILRQSHFDLQELDFGLTLVSTLDDALSSVEGNWQGAVALRTFIVIATRLLSLTTRKIVQQKSLLLLRRARNVSLRWTREVAMLMHETHDEEELSLLKLRVLEMALTCHGAFNVDRRFISDVLGSAHDIAVLVECSVKIHDHCPAKLFQLPAPIQALFRRFTRLTHMLETEFRYRIVTNPEGIDHAIQQLWEGYRPGSSWGALPAPDDRWLTTTTSVEGGRTARRLHFNLITGSFLVNGLPLTRLPREYEAHLAYQRLFGQKVLDVVLSTMSGMDFETKTQISGHHIHFALHGKELIIRSQKHDEICEIVPVHQLEGDFPLAMIRDYVHFLRLDTSSVEWRPINNPWTSSEDNWHMRLTAARSYTLSREGKAFIDVRSPTAQMVSRVLSPLEDMTNIHVVFDHDLGKLDMHLPRFRLDFSLNSLSTAITSKQFRSMVIDPIQSFGALTGLAHKLVLRGVEASSRVVVVPDGKCNFARHGNHVRIMVEKGPELRMKYHAYLIDNQLGRLVDNGDLHSRLFLIYLHALTSHCLTDQLTGRTGTEEALNFLSSAGTCSFVELTAEDLKLLEKIGKLTPQRAYYPSHIRLMQQVEWSDLPSLSQHSAFHSSVLSILDHANSLQVFQEQANPVSIILPNSHDLLERAAIRDSSFQVDGFGGETYTTRFDSVYASREGPIDAVREARVFRTTRLVDSWSKDLTICSNLLSEIESWASPIERTIDKNELPISFDLKWLGRESEVFPARFCSLQQVMATSTPARDKYKIMFMLATFSYAPHAQQTLVETLLAMATVPEMRHQRAPNFDVFQLKSGYAPVATKLADIVASHGRLYYNSAEPRLTNLLFESSEKAEERKEGLFEVAKENNILAFVKVIIAQWPSSSIRQPKNENYKKYIGVTSAVQQMLPLFEKWWHNLKFKEYISAMQSALDKLSPAIIASTHAPFLLPADNYEAKKVLIEFDDLFTNPAPQLTPCQVDDLTSWSIQSNDTRSDFEELNNMLLRVSSRSSVGHGQRYACDLLKSYEALLKTSSTQLDQPDGFVDLLKFNLRDSQHRERQLYNEICVAMNSGNWLTSQTAGMLPRTSKTGILALLSHSKVELLSSSWKIAILNYALSLATLQRAERLVASAGNRADLLKEVQNPGHQDWDPMEHPEWLLLEIENNISVRREQAQIAQEMMMPTSGSNSVMQLNMGQGKSSVIVPIAAAALADKSKLVRVVVLKPLAMQMFHLMKQKVGGLLNRRIVYMPISRSLRLDQKSALRIQAFFEKCMLVGDVVLMQPEHILSFELMGFENLLAEEPNLELGKTLVKTQEWLQQNSRDILDESDEILSVRFELIYTMGTQRAIQFSPDRWTIIQFVLNLIAHSSQEVIQSFPEGLEVLPARKGAFSKIRITQEEAGNVLLAIVARKICEEGAPGVPVWQLPPAVRTALEMFLLNPSWTTAAQKSLDRFSAGSQSLKQALLLLKGLFAMGVLRFCLEQKRWRVQYGLDPSRTMLAVPYHAKDTPAPRAEFSHPDATIVLTCLSYYYAGLTNQQLYTCLENLVQSDNAAREYGLWVRDAPDLPDAFRHINGINLRNTGQCEREVFPSLRFVVRVIDFYLSTVVFPAEMKEFPSKLSSSGWDIAREKRHPTTGFSGTNDSRYILPLSINQCDLPQQLSTNAAVLGCLLRPENTVVDVSDVSADGFLDAEVLIKIASSVSPSARVILDVGAQVLDLQNEEMAHLWLLKTSLADAQAVVFFDAHNELCVLNRDGSKEALHVSPYLKQMDQCLVYLDEFHTRGTDLKLPADYRAIVTLGPKLNKDRLAQACMRLRKLGQGQSVVFCGSSEIQDKIRNHSGNNHSKINVANVLEWCMANTCSYSRKNIPLWATQGLRHQRRLEACSQPFLNAEHQVSNHLSEFLLEPESQSLQERYGGGGSESAERVVLHGNLDASLPGHQQQLADIRTRCKEFDVSSFGTAALHEEQERELSPENEREQEVELPPAAKPLKHTLHQDVQLLVTTGAVKSLSTAFKSAFGTLVNTTARAFYDPNWPGELLVTEDFAKTIQTTDGMDSYLRPVQWIISTRNKPPTLLIVSPYEVQLLMPEIRNSKYVNLHVYTPYLNDAVVSLENLNFCPVPSLSPDWVPPSVTRQLNLFAGQLYIKDYAEYKAVCAFLGLSSKAPKGDEVVRSDGFVVSSSKGAGRKESPFEKSPVEFLRRIVAMRRKGQSFAMSHMGMILNGELISEDEFQS